MRVILAPVFLLAACAADLPGLGDNISSAARARPYPSLAPLNALLAGRDQPSRAQAVAAPLVARGADLQGAIVAEPDTGGLAARGELLRARAAGLRDAPV